MVADRFQQVEILKGKGHTTNTVTDGDDAEKVISCEHRNADAVAAFTEFTGMKASERGGPNFFAGVKVNGIGMVAQGADYLGRIDDVQGQVISFRL